MIELVIVFHFELIQVSVVLVVSIALRTALSAQVISSPCPTTPAYVSCPASLSAPPVSLFTPAKPRSASPSVVSHGLVSLEGSFPRSSVLGRLSPKLCVPSWPVFR